VEANLIPAFWMAFLALVPPAASAGAPAVSLMAAEVAPVDSIEFMPMIGPGDEPIHVEPVRLEGSEGWLRAPFGDNLLMDPGQWRSEMRAPGRYDANISYNRVDQLRYGGSIQFQQPYTMNPRVGGRLEYATGRKRVLYGVQFEQPLLPPGRLAVGVSMTRRTDHSDLQQVDEIENSLALLFGRQDYRDYFEREGYGAYLSWRVPDFSTVSVHVRSDDYRSLGTNHGTRSWFQRDRNLRDNPPIDDGSLHSVLLRLERLTQNTHRTRAGLYHWIELERAGDKLEGDFTYTRALADVRSVMRLTPATTFLLRAVAGHTADGQLPVQKQFTAGGVDGLRAHSFSQFRGDEMMLIQAEYDVGLWRLHSEFSPGGVHAIAFVDAGRAWSNPDHTWDIGRQQMAADGGFGIATSDDDARVYVARNLQDPHSAYVFSFRLQRPF
jgi:hypothetical protein